MRPMIQRISNRIRHRFSPFQKFLFIGGLTGNILFIDTQGTHGPPFIMVASQPRLADIFKNSVLGDFVWGQMIVVVYNG